jgi:hypothetical protein
MSLGERCRRFRAFIRGDGRAPLRARHSISVLILLTMTLGLLLGLALGHWRSSPGPYIRTMTMQGKWIAAPGPPS